MALRLNFQVDSLTTNQRENFRFLLNLIDIKLLALKISCNSLI